PCIAQLRPKPPPGEGWWHEIKFDGYRIIARRDGLRVRLWSRTGIDTDFFLDCAKPSHMGGVLEMCSVRLTVFGAPLRRPGEPASSRTRESAEETSSRRSTPNRNGCAGSCGR